MVALDGRVVMTQTRKPQIVPTEPLARLLAQEWRAQGEEIDPRGFRHRDMADYAIDVIAPDRTGQIDKLLAYGETDTLCYRADPEDALWRRQQDVWEPLVTALEAREGIRMERVSGIVARPLSDETTGTLRQRLERLDIFELAALHELASLAASLCIGLGALESEADGEQLWDAANLEEDWQTERWGIDAEAADRRAQRKAAFLSALEFVQDRCRTTAETRRSRRHCSDVARRCHYRRPTRRFRPRPDWPPGSAPRRPVRLPEQRPARAPRTGASPLASPPPRAMSIATTTSPVRASKPKSRKVPWRRVSAITPGSSPSITNRPERARMVSAIRRRNRRAGFSTQTASGIGRAVGDLHRHPGHIEPLRRIEFDERDRAFLAAAAPEPAFALVAGVSDSRLSGGSSRKLMQPDRERASEGRQETDRLHR